MTGPREADAVRTFGKRAKRYTTSPAHTDAQTLSRFVEAARPRPTDTALDVGTGTGHSALALWPHVRRVIGVDLTPAMLVEARTAAQGAGAHRIAFAVADAHALPVADASVDLLVTRRAAHHFTRIGKAIDEWRRVLRPGARFVVDDRSVPDDDGLDRLLNDLDRIHDPSHVRQYRAARWRAMLEERGFRVEGVHPYTRDRPLSSLTDGVPAAGVRRIRAALAALDGPARAALGVTDGPDGPATVRHHYVLVHGNVR